MEDEANVVGRKHTIHSSVVDRWSLVDSCDRASDDTDDDDDDDDDFEGLSEPVHFSGHSSSLRRCVVASLRCCVVASLRRCVVASLRRCVVRRSSFVVASFVVGCRSSVHGLGWVGDRRGEAGKTHYYGHSLPKLCASLQ